MLTAIGALVIAGLIAAGVYTVVKLIAGSPDDSKEDRK